MIMCHHLKIIILEQLTHFTSFPKFPSDRTQSSMPKPHIMNTNSQQPVEHKPILHLALVIEIYIFYYISVNRWQIKQDQNAGSFLEVTKGGVFSSEVVNPRLSCPYRPNWKL